MHRTFPRGVLSSKSPTSHSVISQSGSLSPPAILMPKKKAVSWGLQHTRLLDSQDDTPDCTTPIPALTRTEESEQELLQIKEIFQDENISGLDLTNSRKRKISSASIDLDDPNWEEPQPKKRLRSSSMALDENNQQSANTQKAADAFEEMMNNPSSRKRSSVDGKLILPRCKR
jgi:hypothetical protein